MISIDIKRVFSACFPHQRAVVLALGAMVLFAPAVRAADALTYFKNYFVTGDYAAAGVGLRGTGVNGFATGTLNMSAVPCTKGVGLLGSYVPCSTSGAVPADIVAAFLYWETDESAAAPAATNGFFDGNAIVGKNLGNASNASCWNSENGATPPAHGRVYRADVLRYLKIDTVNSVRLANGAHTVKLPDSGTTKGPNILLTGGATLVVVYRVVVPGNPLFALLKSVVLYDGAYTVTKTSPGMMQTIGGFYQATGLDAKMTQIVANGQPGFTEVLKANGQSLSSHPFTGTAGVRWDNPTFPIDVDFNDSSFTTEVDSVPNNTCLTWAAIVSSTSVVDTDRDGLLDVWETKGMHLNPGTSTTPATFGGCKDYPSDPCVNLPAMGASILKQDIFVQIDWTHGTGDGTGGTDGRGNHVHIPSSAALGVVCSTFAALPHNIALHFDVGNNYQGQACIVPYKDTSGKVLAQGGSNIDEATLLCPNAVTPANNCTYSEPYAVLSWKRTFLGVKNGYPVLNIPQHFDHNRKDIFHYSLWSHAVAGPFNLTTGQPLSPDPKSISGVADRPGGDLMITLGLWRSDIPANDQVGSVQVQAGTLMHELGHNLDLSHAGLYRTPNCMPDYPSVMNYLYQTRGLTDSAGNEHIDFSYGFELPLNEASLSATQSLGLLSYRVRYFGPLGPGNTAGQAAQVHCDGTPITNGALAVRLEAPSVGTPDWSNGTVNPLGTRFQFDVNFDGAVPENFSDQPDWFSLNLQQVGARPNVDGLSTDIHLGAADLGAADLGAADLGAADLGAADLGAADLGAADLGAADLGAADLGAADLGAADLGDVDQATITLTSPDPPPSPTPTCPAPTCGLLATNEIGDVLLQWAPPGSGTVKGYNIYRCAAIAPATSCTPAPPALYTNVSGGSQTPSYKDTVNDFVHAGATCPAGATCYNTTYSYFVRASEVAGNATVESPSTNTATGAVTHLFVIANTPASIVYGSANPAPTFTIYGNVAGSLSNGSVSCGYGNPGGSVVPRNVGNYVITCSGPATASATDGVTYNASYLTNVPGSLTITQRPITVTATASTKVYDGGVTSPSTPAITSGTLAYTDSPNFTETYDNPNVNPNAPATHVMTPAGIVSDLNGGANYKVIFVTIATGIITPKPVTVTATAAQARVYGAPDPAAFAYTITTGGPLVTGDSFSGALTRVAGENVGSYAINQGTLALSTNYTLTYVGANFTITQALASVTPNANGKTYGTLDPVPLTTGTLAGFLPADSVMATYTRAPGNDAGTYAISASLSTTGLLTNYNITYNPALFTISPAPQSIAFGALPNVPVGTPDFTVTATATSGLAVAFSAAGNCTVTTPAGLVHLVSTGSCTITASQSGSLDYQAAISVIQAFTITGIDFTKLVAVGSPPGIPIATTNSLSMTSATNETSAAWLPAPQPVGNGFTTTFNFQISQIGNAAIADGFAFVIQSSPAGTGALGTTGSGGYLGYEGLTNSIAFEFDTFKNDWDPNANHVAVQSNGTNANTAEHNLPVLLSVVNPLTSVPTNLSDGQVHSVTITYDGTTTLSVVLDGTQVLTAPFSLSSLQLYSGGNAVVGFTAASGSANEVTNISNWSFTAN